MKKRLILLLIIANLLTFTSCGLDYRYLLDEDLHNQVQLYFEEKRDGKYATPSHVIYQENTYMFTETFRVGSDKTDVMIGWNGYRYYGYVDEYYSSTSENPLFIYYKSWVFLHEDYDYTSDTFVINGTSSEIIWKDMLGSERSYFDFSNSIKVEIYSKQCPRIKTSLHLVSVENQWYLSLPESQTVWIASDELIEILSENGFIGS